MGAFFCNYPAIGIPKMTTIQLFFLETILYAEGTEHSSAHSAGNSRMNTLVQLHSLRNIFGLL